MEYMTRKERLIAVNDYFFADCEEHFEYINNIIKKIRKRFTMDDIEIKLQYDPSSLNEFNYILSEITNFEVAFKEYSVDKYQKIKEDLFEQSNKTNFKITEYYAIRREILNIQESYENLLLFYRRNIEYLDDHITITLKNKGYE